MGQFGDSRFGEHRFGGGTAIGRVARTATDEIALDADRTAKYHREAQTFTTDVRVVAERSLTAHRTATTYSDVVFVDSERALKAIRESETYFDGVIVLGAEMGSPHWIIDGGQIHEMIEETRNWQELTLQFRANEWMVKNRLRPLDSSTGKFEIVERPDGSYSAISRAAGKNEVDVTPPHGRQDLRTVSEFVVNDYDEDLADEDAEIYNVELSLVGTEPKDGDRDREDAEQGDGEWLFEFADGSVSTDRIESEMSRGGEEIEGSMEISVVFEYDEVVIVEESLNRQTSVRTRDVPDGQDTIEDNSDGDRNTVEITSPTDRDPDERIIETGEYVVEDWETELINDKFYQIGMEITPI